MGLDSLETKVMSSIDEHRLVDTLCDLIGISSQNPPGEERRIAEYCARRFLEIGMEVQLVAAEDKRTTVIATMHGTEEGPVLLYHAHLDTVPVGDRSKWKFEPLAGHVEDGRIYGRGSCDAKNNIAAMIHVAEALAKSEVTIKGKLIFCFPADEETEGCLGTEYVLNQGYLNDVDMVVVGEQTELQVGIAEKGAARLEVRTKGVSAHASLVAEAGVNAISKMGRILCALDEKYQAGSGEQNLGSLDVTTCNAGIIEGGTKINMVPEYCCLQLDCRFPPGKRAEDIRKEIEELIARLHEENSQLEAIVELIHESLPFETAEDTLLVQRLRQAVKKVRGVDTMVIGYKPVTDGRFFAAKGIPTVIFGAGNALQAHTTNEYVEVDQLIDSALILALLALDVLC